MLDFFKYTEKKLVKDLRNVFAKNEPDLKLDYDSRRGSVRISGDSRFSDLPMVINLANLYSKLRNLKSSERIARLEATIAEALNVEEFSNDDLIASLALRVRTRAELSIRDLYMQVHVGEAYETLSIDANELLLEMVSDRRESLSTVDKQTLDSAEITKDEAFEVAKAALVRATDAEQWLQIDEHIWRSSYDDDYDFARIVSADGEFRLPFDKSALFYAPSHSVVLVCNTLDSAVLARMIELGDQASADHRPLSQNIWQYHGKTKWERWLPESGVQLAQLQSYKELIDNYNEQKNLLDQLLEKAGEDSFVATYQVYQQDQKYRSMCVYTLNVPSYLPKTEWVTVFDADDGAEGSIVGELSWQFFVDAIGQEIMPEISNGRLERFKLLSRLNRDQESALRNNAKPTL